MDMGTHRVYGLLRRDGMRDEHPHQLDGGEARVSNTVQDVRNRVGGLGHKARGSSLRIVRPSCEELNLRSTVTVRNANSARELDAVHRAGENLIRHVKKVKKGNVQVAEGDIVLQRERPLGLDDLVQTVVRGVLDLDVGVGHDRAV